MSLSSKLSITDVDLKGKRVLIRVSQQSASDQYPILTMDVLEMISDADVFGSSA